MDFAEYVRKSDVSENSKIYYSQFLRKDFKKGSLLVKVDEMYKILNSLLEPIVFGREMKVKLDDQSFWWSLPFNALMSNTSLLY